MSESKKAHEIYSSWRKQLQLFHLQKSSTESDKATLLSLLPELTKELGISRCGESRDCCHRDLLCC